MTDHRAAAEQLLDAIAPAVDKMTACPADPIAVSVVGQAAVGHALLDIGAHLATIAEHYRTADLIVDAEVETDETRGLSALAATVADLRSQLEAVQRDAALAKRARDESARWATDYREANEVLQRDLQHKDDVITELRRQLEVALRRADAKKG